MTFAAGANTSDADPQMTHHALAVLGNIRQAQDDLPRALPQLQSAVADDVQFPVAVRVPAGADLGLVYLIAASEQVGLVWLHRAQADGESGHDDADLCQCLRNQAGYFEQIGQPDLGRKLRGRAPTISAPF